MILAFFGRLLAPIAGRLLAWGTIVVAVLGALALVRKSGRDAERADQNQRKLEDISRANEIRDEVDRMPDDAVRDRLFARWGKSKP